MLHWSHELNPGINYTCVMYLRISFQEMSSGTRWNKVYLDKGIYCERCKRL